MTDDFKPSKTFRDIALGNTLSTAALGVDQSLLTQLAGLRDPIQQALARLDLEPFRSSLAQLELQRSALRNNFLSINNSLTGFGSDLSLISQQIGQAQEQLKLRFRMPAFDELSDLRLAILQGATRFAAFGRDVQLAMESMRTPWIARGDLAASVSAFAELQAVGRMIRTLPPFSETLSAELRKSLGAWTAPLKLPDAIFLDPVARSSFYADLGFNDALTNFPNRAFDESVRIAGLAGDEDDATNDAESPIERSVSAYIHLTRLERNIREFIDEVMTIAFGPAWFERHMPNGMYEKWVEKRDKARANGEPEQPLINFADFTDYVLIIQRRDNWSRVFESAFRRLEDVRESFYRLSPIRLVAMHSRVITLDDELLLKVESRRVLKAIGRA
jgi:hypothetical protein